MLKITKDNKASLDELKEDMQKIFIDAFLPMSKTSAFNNHPRLKDLVGEQKQAIDGHVDAIVRQELALAFTDELDKIMSDINNNTDVFIATNRTKQGTLAGFAVFAHLDIQKHLDEKFASISEGSLADIPKQLTNAWWVRLLTVSPSLQKKGLGSALLFSIFNQEPQTSSLYLSTSAAPENAATQKFYEHVGFKRFMKGVSKKAASPFEQEKYVYLYTTKQ